MTITRKHIQKAKTGFGDPNDEEPSGIYFVPEGESSMSIQEVNSISDWELGVRGLLSLPPLILQLQLATYEDEDDEEDFSWDVVSSEDDLSNEEEVEVFYLVYMPTKQGDKWEKRPREMRLEEVEALIQKWDLN